MTMKLSGLYGMGVYSDSGRHLGEVQDLIVDLEKGEVIRITIEPLSTISKDETGKIFKDKSVLYKNVKSVEDVIVAHKYAYRYEQSKHGEPAKMVIINETVGG